MGKPFLCTPFGFLKLLFESLHFFLTLLKRNGHQVPFASECALVKQCTLLKTGTSPFHTGKPRRVRVPLVNSWQFSALQNIYFFTFFLTGKLDSLSVVNEKSLS